MVKEEGTLSKALHLLSNKEWAEYMYRASAKRCSPGCVNAAGMVRQKW